MAGAGGVGALLVVNDTTEDYYSMYDGNGNIVKYVDETSNEVASFEYTPFGAIKSASGSMVDELHYRFSTKYFDNSTNLIVYRYRNYNPQTGKWQTRDPLGELTKEGNFNFLYAFVTNNPISNWDLLGLSGNSLNGWGLGNSGSDLWHGEMQSRAEAIRRETARKKREKVTKFFQNYLLQPFMGLHEGKVAIVFNGNAGATFTIGGLQIGVQIVAFLTSCELGSFFTITPIANPKFYEYKPLDVFKGFKTGLEAGIGASVEIALPIGDNEEHGADSWLGLGYSVTGKFMAGASFSISEYWVSGGAGGGYQVGASYTPTYVSYMSGSKKTSVVEIPSQLCCQLRELVTNNNASRVVKIVKGLLRK
ncbi:RHS repeat-associated core domain-containing protein [Lentisphaerota bacterium WC36G]|nr:hypothetical protein LJT99_02865 [Lentisphaerae bacterium WC36]